MGRDTSVGGGLDVLVQEGDRALDVCRESFCGRHLRGGAGLRGRGHRGRVGNRVRCMRLHGWARVRVRVGGEVHAIAQMLGGGVTDVGSSAGRRR